MNKHTPGPWQYRIIDGSIGGIDDAKGNPVGQSFAVPIEGKRNIPAIFKANRERIANAILMAAAPELLAALESEWQWMESQADAQSKGGHATFDLMMLREQRDIARAAIDKATGES